MIIGSSIVQFHQFSASPVPDQHNLYTLTRIDNGKSIKIDKTAVDLVERLSKGMTVEEAAEDMEFSVYVCQTIIKMLQGAHMIERSERVKFTKTSRVEFYPLRYSQQPDEHNLYGIVRWETDDGLKVDKDVTELMKQLSQGKTISEAAHETGYSVDVVMTVLKMLREAHFIKRINDLELYDSGKKIKPWLTGIDRRWFRWIISKPMLFLIIPVTISGIVAGIVYTGIPTYKTFFWTPDVFLVFLSLFVADIVLLISHEGAHFIVTKAVGGEAVMRINYRYIFLVGETESYHLSVVPKRQRYLVYLSGSIWDLFTVGIMYWVILICMNSEISLGVFYNFLLAMILMQLLGVIWQFNAFLETDMYNFLSEYLGIENLRIDAIKYINLHTQKWKQLVLLPIKKLLQYLTKGSANTSDDFRLLTKSERKKLFLYTLFLISGIIFTTIQFVFFDLPRDFIFLREAVMELLRVVKNADISSILKSGIIIGFVLFDYLLLIFLKQRELVKKHHKRRR